MMISTVTDAEEYFEHNPKDKTSGKTRIGYILGVTLSTYFNPKKHIVTELFCNELDDEKQNAINKAKFKELQETEALATVECDFRTIAWPTHNTRKELSEAIHLALFLML